MVETNYEIIDSDIVNSIYLSDFSSNINIEKITIINKDEYQIIRFKLLLSKIDYKILLSKLHRMWKHSIYNFRNDRKLYFNNYMMKKDINFLQYLFKNKNDSIECILEIEFKNQLDLIKKLFGMEELYMDCNECKYLNICEYEQKILKIKNKKDKNIHVIEHECEFYNEKLYHYPNDDTKIKPCELCEQNEAFVKVKE